MKNPCEYPVGWREISAAEYANVMTSFVIYGTEYRQFDSTSIMHGVLHFISTESGDAEGVAVVHGFDKDYNSVASFFAFGCQHDFQETNWDESTMGKQTRYDRVNKCTKCGKISIFNDSF